MLDKCELQLGGPKIIHPRMPEELAKEISESQATIFCKVKMTGKAQEDCRRANIVPIFKKRKRKTWGITD